MDLEKTETVLWAFACMENERKGREGIEEGGESKETGY